MSVYMRVCAARPLPPPPPPQLLSFSLSLTPLHSLPPPLLLLGRTGGGRGRGSSNGKHCDVVVLYQSFVAGSEPGRGVPESYHLGNCLHCQWMMRSDSYGAISEVEIHPFIPSVCR